MTDGLTSEIAKEEAGPPQLRVHTPYYIGKQRIPSVTTIIDGQLGWKWPALMGWQRRELLAGRDPEKTKGHAANIGDLAHAMIEEFLVGKVVDLSWFSDEVKNKAGVAFESFQAWYGKQDLKVIATEQSLTHGRHRYGGTIDLLAKLNGKFSLIDFKSSRQVWVDHRIQLAAYRELVRHRYNKIPATWILHLGKDEPAFGANYYSDLTKELKVFRLCLRMYELSKDLK